jgi:hypothetical protein
VILAILAVVAVCLAVGLFFAFLIAGLFVLPRASGPALLFTWDGLVITFLFFWGIGLLTELQRSDPLSLDKFLHLPVSLSGVFFLNYLSSLFSFGLLLFVPAMVGLCLGLVIAKGATFLLLLPLLAAFLLMVTAVTYQFQGWLASLMVNKRRRRTIIVLVTAGFVLLCQLPNLLNVFQPWRKAVEARQQLNTQLVLEDAELKRALAEKKITPAEYQQREGELVRQREAQVEEQKAQGQQIWQGVQRTTRVINLVLPPGWLPLGATVLAEGDVFAALLGTVGMALIGAASLWRGYRTTLRLYTGQFTAGKEPRVVAAPTLPAVTAPVAPPAYFMERKLPWLSEQATAIALASFRSLVRAPEAKMLLLTPILMIVVFGGIFLRSPMRVPEAARPLPVYGAMAMILFSMVQLIGNQFGFDRNGFRVYVLCAARRSDILLGKNLATAPIAFGMGILVAAALQVLYPMRIDFFLAALVQIISMYLVFCGLANWLSILAPMFVHTGTMKASNIKGIPLLLHLAFMFLFPVAMAPLLLPLAIQFIGEQLGVPHNLPICLLLSLAECAAILYLYRLALHFQGDLLQAREQKILDTVRMKAE